MFNEKSDDNTMEAHSRWYDDISKEINLHKDILGKKESKKYKLDLLLRVAKRVDGFSSNCGECQMSQPDITQLTQDLGYIVQMPKEKRKGYFKKINNVIKHLRKYHKLISEEENRGHWIAIGAATGVAIGASLDNVGVGIAIGIGIGIAIGSYLDAKAKKEGKVI